MRLFARRPRPLGHLITRADAARDAGRHAAAAVLYGEALLLGPERADLHIQHGHMLKESGELDAAARAYDAAYALSPGDADLALQRGHLHGTAGRPQAARAAYAEALALRPDWAEPASRIEILDAELAAAEAAAASVATPEQIETLAPGLAPRRIVATAPALGIDLFRLGRDEITRWGRGPTLRGIEAVRGLCVATDAIDEVELLIDGVAHLTAQPTGPFPIKSAPTTPITRWAFNLWFDFSAIEPGPHRIGIRGTGPGGAIEHDEEAVVAPPIAADWPESDGDVRLASIEPALLETAIKALPSRVRPANRSALPSPVRTILVQRTDQLGDLVSSLPALRRLKLIFPEARIVGLVTAANADLAATLDLFDETIVIDFPDDPVERRRIMPLDMQEALRRRLAPYAFDIAIDLADSNASRELLRLSGARLLYGTGGEWPWLNGAFHLNVRDPRNRMDVIPHGAKALAMVESLGAAADTRFETVRRADLDRARLDRFGLGPDERYIVLHTGGRIAFARWPHYTALVEAILTRTDLSVVLIGETPDATASPRLHLLTEALPFDDFDALVSFADALVGNDSGPKHLAALRGVPAVTIFSARINWQEWGQEGSGVIISRQLPCAGCAIFHEPESCGQDFHCIRGIAPEEVFSALESVLTSSP